VAVLAATEAQLEGVLENPKDARCDDQPAVGVGEDELPE
jgi:hypothetical protein